MNKTFFRLFPLFFILCIFAVSSLQADEFKRQEGMQLASVSAGGQHTCGVKSDGTGICWGDNFYGQRNVPGGTFLHLSTGTFHTCGIRNNGGVECWGYNSDGQWR